MADPQSPPFPDRGHEALRQDILAAVADLNLNTGDVQSSFELQDLLFQYIGQLLDDVSALNIRCDALQIDRDTAMASIDDLQRRIGLLENPLPQE